MCQFFYGSVLDDVWVIKNSLVDDIW